MRRRSSPLCVRLSATRRGTRRAPVLRPRPPCEAGRQTQRWRRGRAFTGAGSGSFSGLLEAVDQARLAAFAVMRLTPPTPNPHVTHARRAESTLSVLHRRAASAHVTVRARKSSTTFVSRTIGNLQVPRGRQTSTAPRLPRRGNYGPRGSLHTLTSKVFLGGSIPHHFWALECLSVCTMEYIGFHSLQAGLFSPTRGADVLVCTAHALASASSLH